LANASEACRPLCTRPCIRNGTSRPVCALPTRGAIHSGCVRSGRPRRWSGWGRRARSSTTRTPPCSSIRWAGALPSAFMAVTLLCEYCEYCRPFAFEYPCARVGLAGPIRYRGKQACRTACPTVRTLRAARIPSACAAQLLAPASLCRALGTHPSCAAHDSAASRMGWDGMGWDGMGWAGAFTTRSKSVPPACRRALPHVAGRGPAAEAAVCAARLIGHAARRRRRHAGRRNALAAEGPAAVR
jgi:hypothetical protein